MHLFFLVVLCASCLSFSACLCASLLLSLLRVSVNLSVCHSRAVCNSNKQDKSELEYQDMTTRTDAWRMERKAEGSRAEQDNSIQQQSISQKQNTCPHQPKHEVATPDMSEDSHMGLLQQVICLDSFQHFQGTSFAKTFVGTPQYWAPEAFGRRGLGCCWGSGLGLRGKAAKVTPVDVLTI